MNIMVIGGSGFIGSHIIKLAIEQGHKVEVIDIKNNQLGVKTIIWDIGGIDMASFDFSSYDLVIIEAAVTSQLEDGMTIFDTNVKGLFNVIEACRKSKVSKVLFASSSAVYEPNNLYAMSKQIGEQLVNTYIRKRYFEGVVLRYFNTYGIGENSKGVYKSIISIFLESIAKDKNVVVYGDGSQSRDFINVKDVARITLELGLFHYGTFDVGTGDSTSWTDIIYLLREHGLSFKVNRIDNPIKDYQYFTRANISELVKLDLRPKIDIRKGIGELIEATQK